VNKFISERVAGKQRATAFVHMCESCTAGKSSRKQNIL